MRAYNKKRKPKHSIKTTYKFREGIKLYLRDYIKTIRTFEIYRYDIYGEKHYLKLNCKNNKMDKLD
jgi:hypothetical protein